MNASADLHAHRRPAHRIRVGWWVRGYEDSGSGRWSEVTTIMDDVLTGQRFRRIFCADGSLFLCQPTDWATCCTKAEAKRAGLVTS